MTTARGIDQNAPIVVRLETRIAAPVEAVWALHTGIDDWTTWHTDITEARLNGSLAPGSRFRWSTAGLTIDSTLYAVEAPHRILWGGPAHGITGIHCWTFEADGDTTLVRTEESWGGEPVRANTDAMRHALEQSLRRWLDILRETAEA
ncbi:SRPBCC family protein [Nocardia sp. NPDC051787]|uniref:SRPBCC family protein n=1 Tax=Nocardia sp. NPDC051787 TaxID=3155415 RepID=UPI003424B1D8